MKVKTAKTAGFCFGVSRAVDKVYELIEEGVSPIYTLGPIIHNEEVVGDLEAKGVRVITEDDLKNLRSGTVVIRSHGVGKAVYQMMESSGLDCVDVTCPFVLKIHRIVETYYHFWRSLSSGGERNLRMVRRTLYRAEHSRRSGTLPAGERRGVLYRIPDDI